MHTNAGHAGAQRKQTFFLLAPEFDFFHLRRSRGVGEDIGQASEQCLRNFDHVGFLGRLPRNRGRPEALADKGQGVAEGWQRSGIPDRLAHQHLPALEQLMREQTRQREPPQQQRRGAPNRHIRPLAPGFDAQVRARFLEGRFQLPALHEPRDDPG
jgi:hypothetical protein